MLSPLPLHGLGMQVSFPDGSTLGGMVPARGLRGGEDERNESSSEERSVPSAAHRHRGNLQERSKEESVMSSKRLAFMRVPLLITGVALASPAGSALAAPPG